jgi:Rho family protein
MIPNTSVECFLALLEYMYTDHSPIKENDSVGIMVLADEYGQSRLIDLCELYILSQSKPSLLPFIDFSMADVCTSNQHPTLIRKVRLRQNV